MTMNTSMRQLIAAMTSISSEKGISEEQVREAVREGIKTSLRKSFPETAIINIVLDEDQDLIRGYRLFKLVEQIEDVEAEMLFNEITDEVVIDGYVHEEFPINLNRQQINITKQVTLGKIRRDSQNQQVENLIAAEEFKIFSGVVKVIRREEFLVDCRGVEISIPKNHCLPRDTYSLEDKIFFTLLQDEKGNWIGSRTSNEFLIELFKSKIPEVADGVIEIVSCARNPGFRSKVIVRSNDPDVRAMAICIGAKGANIKNINKFMNNENVDVIEYEDDIAKMIIKAIKPVNLCNIVVDEEHKVIELSIPDEEIAQAIGKSGKSIDLISRLLGWKIDAYSETQWAEKAQNELAVTIDILMFGLNCDEDLASMLASDGFEDLTSIAYAPVSEFEDLDEELVSELKSNAKETLDDVNKMLVVKGMNHLRSHSVSSDNLATLHKENIFTLQDIADLATDEILDILPDFDKNKASAIIMTARDLLNVAEEVQQ